MTTNVIVYEGVHVSLGLVRDFHAEAFVRFANRHEHVHGTRLRPPYAEHHFASWLESLATSKGKDEVFCILAHEDSPEGRAYRYIGHTGVHRILYPQAHATTGTVIGDPDAQGRGYGKEAKLLLQKHAFDALNLHKLKSEVKAFNAASLGHLLACGYTVYGRAREEDLHHGKRVDTILLECFRADWEPIWQEYQRSGVVPRLTDAQRAFVTKETT